MVTVLLLTRLGGPVFALNPDLIERAEATPDTVVTLVNGTRYVICESLEELSRLVRDYRAETAAAAYRRPAERRVAHGDDPAGGTVVELRPGDP
jgi:flagellar protein FlbD